MLNASSGPVVVFGQTSAIPGVGTQSMPLPPDYNPDRSASAFDIGYGLLDPRLSFLPGGGTGSVGGVVIQDGASYAVIDQVPSALATANIAALANAVNGTAMTLVSTSGAGITVLAAPLTIPQTGQIIPAGALCIDGLPALIQSGQNGQLVVADPRKQISRAISVTGVTGGTGGAFTVKGADLYGMPMTQTLTATAGATTVATTKAFKFIYSVTPTFADAHNYSIGTADVFGFPLLAQAFGYSRIVWNNGVITASAGFVAPDATSPATGATGDPRGTYAVQSASDGTKALQVFMSVAPFNANTVAGVFGVTPA